MFYTLDQAVKVTGSTKSAILSAIECGQIAGTKNLFGEWEIEQTELEQVYPFLAENAVNEGPPLSSPPDAVNLEAEIAVLIKETGERLRGHLNDAYRDTALIRNPGGAGECSATSSKNIECCAWNPEIRINGFERVSESASYAQRTQAALVTAAVVSTLGIGGIIGLLFLRHSPISIPVEQEAQVRGSKGQSDFSNFETRGEATASVPNTGRVAAPAARALGHRLDPPQSAAQRPGVMKAPSPAQQNTGSIGAATSGVGQRPKILPRSMPFPETKPTTIEGWTVRDVVGGTAILEGPEGIRRVMRGDAVPGVGRVESIVRWGPRWIVATSRGLISTP